MPQISYPSSLSPLSSYITPSCKAISGIPTLKDGSVVAGRCPDEFPSSFNSQQEFKGVHATMLSTKKTCRLERSSIPEIVSVVTIILDSSSHSFLHHWVPRHPSDRYMDEQHTHSHVEGVFLSKGTTFEACISLFWIKRLWLKMSDAKVQRVLRFQISILGPILTGPWTVPHLNSMKLTYKHHFGHQKIWFTACKLKMTCGIKNLARYHSNSLALLNFNLLNFCPFGMETQHIL